MEKPGLQPFFPHSSSYPCLSDHPDSTSRNGFPSCPSYPSMSGDHLMRSAKYKKEHDTFVLNVDDEEIKKLEVKVEKMIELESLQIGNNFGDGDSFYEAMQVNRMTNEKYDFHGLEMYEEDEDFVPYHDSDLGDKLYEEYDAMTSKHFYKSSLEFRLNLPAYKVKSEILNLVNDNQVVVVSGETGSGKTTQLPQILLDEMLSFGMGDICKIVCTQPRRISAISVAQRVSYERAEMCGGSNASVGYQVQLERNVPREKGSILYCTTGVVLQWLKSNPTLDGISHLILDEIHERDINSDFLITILKDFVLPLRKDLKLILMSATLNAKMFADYFDHCITLEIPGVIFPVEEYFLEDTLQLFKLAFKEKSPRLEKIWRNQKEVATKILPYAADLEETGQYSQLVIESLKMQESENIQNEFIATVISLIHFHYDEGAILVFVKGWEEIRKISQILQEMALENVKLFPIHSLLPTATQREVFEKPPVGTRKIVIATNIAETSITIDDVVYVVDTGKANVEGFDIRDNVQTLNSEWISLANMKQRRGRAGRVQPGICFHLFSKARRDLLKPFIEPEIKRKRLEDIVLQIKFMGFGSPIKYLNKMLEPPSEDAVKFAVKTLTDMSTLDEDGGLLPLGYHLSKLPMDVQCGKMVLLGTIFGCLDPILSVVASLSYKNPFYMAFSEEEKCRQAKVELAEATNSDHMVLVNAVKQYESICKENCFQAPIFCEEHFLTESIMKNVVLQKKKLFLELKRMGFVGRECQDYNSPELNRHSLNLSVVAAIIGAGLYPNVAEINMAQKKPCLLSATERRIKIHKLSVNADEKFFNPDSRWMVYFRKIKTYESCVFECGEISPFTLMLFGRDLEVLSTKRWKTRDMDTVRVDGTVKLLVPSDFICLVTELKMALGELLEFKVRNPGNSNWDENNKEGSLLKLIVEFLSNEI